MRSSTRLVVATAAIVCLTAFALAPSVSATSTRSGHLSVTKECSGFTGAAGSFCRITSSSLKAIEVGSKIIYLQPANIVTPAGSDVVLDLPGPGNNTASGHCTLDPGTGNGLCTFSGGTGKFTWFHGSVNVSYLGGLNYGWEGTYSFSPR
jgi:hypothetical protein